MKAGTCRWPTGCDNSGGWRGYCLTHYHKLYHADHIRSGFVPAAILAARIRQHLDRGRSVRSLARLCRVNNQSLTSILRGRTSRVRLGTADRVMAAPLRPSHVGCERRVGALRRLGHTTRHIADAAGVGLKGLEGALARREFSDHMSAALARAYEALSGSPGTSRAAARVAARRGIPGPLAWEDVDIDDPAAVPDAGVDRPRTAAELLAEFAHLTAGGISPQEAARKLGVDLAGVRRCAGGGDLSDHVERSCGWCRRTFAPSRSTRRYCCVAHKRAAARKRHREAPAPTGTGAAAA
ncbi:MAG: hypothetical protein LC799_01540 [Actinobacteria bacterium]|nr:hypothetical protein [Actinomycetota bacterium]